MVIVQILMLANLAVNHVQDILTLTVLSFAIAMWNRGSLHQSSDSFNDPWQMSFVFTALASEERGSMIARVCMSVHPSVCVSPKCAMNIDSPRRCRTMGFYLAVSHPAKHHVCALYLTLPWFAMIAICCIVTLVEAMN
jgi:hypothetical protein